MNVSACLVTRGDVDMRPIIESLPAEWEKVVWDNRGVVSVFNEDREEPYWCYGQPDVSVYGRYSAIEYASHDAIYVQDDDVIVSDPQVIVDAWLRGANRVVCNMPQEFRHGFYSDHSLVGFGACFHRDAPKLAFGRFFAGQGRHRLDIGKMVEVAVAQRELMLRTCDVVFTTLTPRLLVDVPKTNLPHAHAEDRMWKQSQHVEERTRMLNLARKVRDEA